MSAAAPAVRAEREKPLNLERLLATAAQLRRTFHTAAPYPHLVLDDFLDPAVADALAAEYELPSLDWRYYYHVNEKKLAVEDLSQMGPVSRLVIAELQSPAFVDALCAISGLEGLIADPAMDGGGLQQTRRGGYLNVHTDFLSHATRRNWSRQVNLLLYLNREWPESYKGGLELWDANVQRCVRRIAPTFNRCVIFRTGATSFHGIPEAVACPPGDARKALALYYFRDEGRVTPLRPTFYAPLPDDPLRKRALIRIDRWLVYAYTALKRYTPIGNDAATRLLRRLGARSGRTR
jgi:Rps23 Pro-64 3,4-dihydroxylase Tpa1-like proline 4-hydroxylase